MLLILQEVRVAHSDSHTERDPLFDQALRDAFGPDWETVITRGAEVKDIDEFFGIPRQQTPAKELGIRYRPGRAAANTE
jgi:hypothetical protein